MLWQVKNSPLHQKRSFEMKQLVWRSIFAAFVVAAVCGVALAEANKPAAAVTAATVVPSPALDAKRTVEKGSTSDFEKWCADIKKPAEWFCWGADYQYRAVYQNNNKTLSNQVAGHEQAYDRNIARIWTVISPTKDIDINARFMWAWWDYWEPESSEAITRSEGLFDNLNVKFKNLFDTKSALTVGRQDIFC
jgi:hypothetical protein